MDHFIRGDSIKRIAQRDRIPAGTVLSRIFTGKRLLRAAWEEPCHAAWRALTSRRHPQASIARIGAFSFNRLRYDWLSDLQEEVLLFSCRRGMSDAGSPCQGRLAEPADWKGLTRGVFIVMVLFSKC